MPVVVGQCAGGATRIRNSLHGIVNQIVVIRQTLLSYSLRGQTAIAIVAEASGLARLVAARNLIARIVSIGGRGVHRRVPIQIDHLSTHHIEDGLRFKIASDAIWQVATGAMNPAGAVRESPYFGDGG